VASWVTESDLLEALAASLHRASASALLADAPFWAQCAANALASTYGDLRRLLANVGYCQSQLDAWDGSAEQRDLALLEALERGGGLEEVEHELLSYLQKRRDELLRGFLLYDAAGALVPPLCGGRVGHGTIKRQPSVFQEPHAPVRSQYPEWSERFKRW
jgi:hypothetical protein